jgi:hypothetical protein
MQGIVLPADEDVARAIVIIHDVRNAVLIVAIAADIDGETQIVGQGLDGL